MHSTRVSYCKYFQVLIILLLSVSINSNAQEKGIKDNRANNSACIGKLTVIDSLLKHKIAYEKYTVFENARIRNEEKEAYYKWILLLKNNQQQITDCIRILLADSSYGKKGLYDFSYLNPQSSHIGPCHMMSRRKILQTILYNLDVVRSDTALICPVAD